MLNLIRQYLSFSGKHKNLLIQSVIWQFIKSIGRAFQYFAIYIVITDMTQGTVTGKTALHSFIVMVISMGILILSGYYGKIMEAKSSFYMCAEKRTEIGDQLKYMPMGFFNEVSIGKITATATNTLESLQNEGTIVMINVFSGIVNAIVLLVFMTIFDARIGAVSILGVLIFLGLNSLLRKKSVDVYPQRHKAQISIVGAILEYIQGISVIRSYNLAKEANGKLNKAITECEKQNIKIEFAFIPYLLFQSISLKMASVAIILTSVWLYTQSAMETSVTIMMLIVSFSIFQETEAGGTFSALSMLVERGIDDVNAQLSEPIMTNNGKNAQAHGADIFCNNITFSYDKKKIIDNVTLKINSGTTTAIVGPSGGGKTTLCNLITRFWDVNEGSISLDGKDIRNYKVDDLLGNFSMVFQNVYLFKDTIANNIKFGKPDATIDEIKEAAKKACCHTFIESLPNGYDTIVGEGGSTISGGEKQRISIARAMLKDAPVIILDEATANVDPENEKELQEAIEQLTKDKTIIMIAHRLKTIKSADQILVVESGKITEQGTHDELIGNNKTYAKFVSMREKSIGWKLGSQT